MTTRASFSTKSAPLFDEFGLKYATKLFGEETIASLPLYVRGPKKGKIKAWLIWIKCESGGWYRGGRFALGGVVYPGLYRAWITNSPYGLECDALQGQWIGRIQTLAGHRDVLTAEYREQETARRASYDKELIEKWKGASP